MTKIVLFLLVVVLAGVLSFPAAPEGNSSQETPLARLVRAAAPDPDPHHHKHGYGHGYGGYEGYGYKGFGHGHPHGGFGGGFAQSSAQAGSISTPFGSASFSHAEAGSFGR